MPHGRKRTQAEYEREIEEASKRIRKKRENIKSARDSDTFRDFLTNTFGVSPQALNNGADFWESVRENVHQYDREVIRRSKYAELIELGFTSAQAKRMRDWSETRIQLSMPY